MVNLSFLEEFTKGDQKKMKRYIKLYLSIAPDTFNNMGQNIADQDWEHLRINAHSLKPQTDYMGIPELKAVLEQIEHEAKNGQGKDLQVLFKEAQKLHVESEAFLQEYIGRD